MQDWAAVAGSGSSRHSRPETIDPTARRWIAVLALSDPDQILVLGIEGGERRWKGVDPEAPETLDPRSSGVDACPSAG